MVRRKNTVAMSLAEKEWELMRREVFSRFRQRFFAGYCLPEKRITPKKVSS